MVCSFCATVFDIDNKRTQFEKLSLTLNNLTTWDSTAIAMQKERAALESCIQSYDSLASDLTLYKELISTSDLSDEDISEIVKGVAKCQNDYTTLENFGMFSGEYDKGSALFEINAGAGGTDAQDWAEILERMYLRFFEKQGIDCEILVRTDGEEAGIKQVVMRLTSPNTFGLLRYETGVHRLVRISPFNANDKRQTSFASVLVTPYIENPINVTIDEKDLRIDTYRSSGAGGQHVNKTESAVRITHVPTGTVAACQQERSQPQNKAEAMKMLLSKLYLVEQERVAREKKGIEKSDISWGNQIRNYVLQPYKLIKDLRTGVETGDVESVLNGDISEFINREIRFFAKKPHEAQ
jgi:peptide chain release factor 2